MKRILKYFDIKNKLASKFFVLFILLVLVPSFIMGYIYYNQASRTIIDDMLDNAWKNLQPVESQLSSVLQVVNNTFVSLYTDEVFIDILSDISKEQTWGEQFDDLLAIDKIFSKHIINEHIYNIRIYLPPEKFYSNQNVRFCSRDMLNDIGLTDIDDYYNDIVWMLRKDFKETDYSDEITLLSGFFTFKNSDGMLVTVEVDLFEESFFNASNMFYLYDNSEFFVVNEDGSIVSSRLKEKLALNIRDEFGVDKSLSEGINLIGEDYYLKKNMNVNDWYIIVNGNVRDLAGQRSIISYTLILLVLEIILAMIVTALFFLRANKRLNALGKAMSTIDKLQDVKPEVTKNNDEIDQLARYFGEMVDRLKSMVDEIHRINEDKRQSELNLLLSQINPHFIYNSLETINWKAIDLKAFDVSKSINKLSKFMRMSLNTKDNEISIKQEIIFIELYAEMQKELINNEFELIVDVSDELAEYKMPKFILQPLVENSIIHGIAENEKQDSIIKVSCVQEDGFLHFEVFDNGVGIDAEKLNDITSELLNQNDDQFFALVNIERRLKLEYGEMCGLVISSEKFKYTKIQFKIPINFT